MPATADIVAGLETSVDAQIDSNRGTNLFCEASASSFTFLPSTIDAIQTAGDIAPSNLDRLADYTADRVVQEFCRVNQYFQFNPDDTAKLGAAYQNLYRDIIDSSKAIAGVARDHHEKLKQWLGQTNPFSQGLYRQAGAVLPPIPCSEYDAALQTDILQLDNIPMVEPILDVGCGTSVSLVRWLRQEGFDAYGIDRFSHGLPFVWRADWLAYCYGNQRWGTVVSNLGFSNHLIHHRSRGDGDVALYANKYVEIVRSLKVGGTFRYVPGLPFIEQQLGHQAFRVDNYGIEGSPFKTTIVTRLRA